MSQGKKFEWAGQLKLFRGREPCNRSVLLSHCDRVRFLRLQLDSRLAGLQPIRHYISSLPDGDHRLPNATSTEATYVGEISLIQDELIAREEVLLDQCSFICR